MTGDSNQATRIDLATREPASEPGELRPDYYRVKLPVRRCDTGERVMAELECFDVIAALGLGFFEGNILKYLWRCGRKTLDRREDLKKVSTYAKQAWERCQS